MDYSDLNNFLGNLEVNNGKNTNINAHKNLDANNSYINKDFLAKEQFLDNSIKQPPKSRSQIENLQINRNSEIHKYQSGFNNFNFESYNPQRQQIVNSHEFTINGDSYSENGSDSRKNKKILKEDLQLSRNLQINNFAPKHISIMNYSDFSENYKDYSNNSVNEDVDSLNTKLASRENIPNISSMPESLWKK